MATGRDVDAVKVGPGRLYIAEISAVEPTSLTGALDAGWIDLGYTDAGSEFSLGRTTEDVEVAEETFAIRTIVTDQPTTIAFALAQITAKNLYWALQGGTVTTTAVESKFEPPEPGEELYFKLIWQDLVAPNNQERWLWRKVFNTGESAIPRRKGADKAVIPVTFSAYKPDSGKTFTFWTLDDFSGAA